MNVRIAQHLDAFKRAVAFLKENSDGFADSAAARDLNLSLEDVIGRIEDATVSAVCKQFSRSNPAVRHGRC
jgi:hypothetical protein